VEYAADAVVITDTSGRVQYVNPAFTTLTGYSREEAVGQNTRFLKSGRQSTAFYEELWSTILSGRVWQGDVTNRRKDGTLFDEEMRIAPVKDSKGVTTGYIAIKHDVSERRAHQQALRDSLEFAQSTIDALSSHICVLDETGAIIAVNRAWMDYGEANRPEGWDKASKADEWRDCIGVGVNYLEVCRRRGGLEADEAADFADGIRAVLKGERKEYSREYSCHSPGVQRWFLGRVARFNTGNLCRIVIEHIDITERRRAEQVMLESENRFRIMADSSPIGIWVTDAQGGALFINRTYREFVGRTTEQVGPETWKSLMHPEDAPAYFKAFSEALQNKQPFKCDGRFQRADGQWRWTASYATPRFSQEGEFQGFAGITKDITERVQTVQALRSSEERFRQLAENVREVFRIVPISVDETLYVSPAYEQIWGRGMDSIYENPASWLEAVHPDDREQADLMAVHQLRGDPIEVEYRIQTPDGQKKWIRDRSFPIRDQSGELIRSIGIAEEITERKQAEILLKQTADRLVLAASAGGAGIWDLDYVNNVLHWDEQMYRLYATTKDEFSISPEACRALVHPEDRSHMEEEMYAAARGEKEFDCQFRIVWPDGSIRHIRANALVRWDAKGNPLQIVGTNRDITSQKQAAAALMKTNLRLQFEIHRRNRVALRICDANLRRQIMRDRERGLAITLRRKPGHVHDAEAQPARVRGDEGTGHLVVRGFFQHEALRRLIAGGDFKQTFAQGTVGLQPEFNFTTFERLHSLEFVAFLLRLEAGVIGRRNSDKCLFQLRRQQHADARLPGLAHMILGVRKDDKVRADIVQQLVESNAALVEHGQCGGLVGMSRWK